MSFSEDEIMKLKSIPKEKLDSVIVVESSIPLGGPVAVSGIVCRPDIFNKKTISKPFASSADYGLEVEVGGYVKARCSNLVALTSILAAAGVIVTCRDQIVEAIKVICKK